MLAPILSYGELIGNTQGNPGQRDSRTPWGLTVEHRAESMNSFGGCDGAINRISTGVRANCGRDCDDRCAHGDRESCQRVRRRRNGLTGDDAQSHAYGHCRARRAGDADRESDTHGHADAHGYADADGHSDPDRQPDADAHADPQPDRDADAHSDVAAAGARVEQPAHA